MAMTGMPQTLRADTLCAGPLRADPLCTGRPDREADPFLRFATPFFGPFFGPFSGPLYGWPADALPLPALRRGWSLLATTLGHHPPVAAVKEQWIDGPEGEILLRVYTPLSSPSPHAGGEAAPALLWCHGGGFVVGDLDANDSICRGIARASGAIVVAVRYRLVPEHSLYAGREDFLAALRWIARHGRKLGIDTSRLAIGGDSAGGNISAAVAQENLRRGGPKILRQILVYPATNLVDHVETMWKNIGRFLPSAEAIGSFIDSLKRLVDHGEDMADPWLSPAFGQIPADLPPATILSAGFDPIRDDGLAYAAALRAASIPVELLHYPGQFHGFLNFDSINGSARDAVQRIGAALHRAFAAEEAPDRTLEITDQPALPSLFQPKILADAMTAAMLLGRATRQWSDTAIRHLPPGTAGMADLLFQPWLMPMAMGGKTLALYLNGPSARQTWPLRTAA